MNRLDEIDKLLDEIDNRESERLSRLGVEKLPRTHEEVVDFLFPEDLENDEQWSPHFMVDTMWPPETETHPAFTCDCGIELEQNYNITNKRWETVQGYEHFFVDQRLDCPVFSAYMPQLPLGWWDDKTDTYIIDRNGNVHIPPGVLLSDRDEVKYFTSDGEIEAIPESYRTPNPFIVVSGA